MIRSAFDKVTQAHKSALEELEKSFKNKPSYEDTYIQLESRTEAMGWVLEKREDEFQELLKAAGEAKKPLPIAESMVGDLHTQAWFEATPHM